MTEAAFLEFYTQTARPLKSYLSRITGKPDLAEDLMQESFFRILRAELPELDAAQRRSYLFRIATNLARDGFRRHKFEPVPLTEHASPESLDGQLQTSADVHKVLGEIRPEEREIVWLAYVEGASHREIAAVTGFQEASIRPMLFRARKKLATLLRREHPNEGGKP